MQIIGRSRRSHPRLESGSVSAAHASIRHTKGRWLVRDLGSRNGTWVNGERLPDATWRVLREGDCVQFACAGERWWLVDASIPSASATSGGLRTDSESGLLVLPNAENPEVSIVHTNGSWKMDRQGDWVAVEDRQQLEIGGVLWTLSLPDVQVDADVTDTTPGEELALDGVVLELAVSDNEESVWLSLMSENGRVALPERAFHYLLLVLARARLADVAAGADRWAAGWVTREELLGRLTSTPEALNVDIHRVRRQLAQAGVKNATDIIERRHGAAELRLGTDAVVIRGGAPARG
ncbi:MAG: FHA domain-containing protein [Labilithrix sp.]|nr:FHA domain-containing protein [Labilithrix sp.]